MTGDPAGTRTLAAALLRRAAAGEVDSPAHLRILDGPMAGRRLPLGEEETLGRGAGATLHLADPAASRLHLALRVSRGSAEARDLGSKNGAEVNGRRLGRRRRRLRSGDVLSLGSTRLAIEIDAPRGPRARQPTPRRGIPAAGALLLAAGAALLLGLLG
jgi:pSer/pThr/pTyr-binding forkhead associated (FHA) protein